ncbi:hypothetical protein C6P92_19220 [Burkholderia multivorans]|nr:hypothetical protein C6P92_19220 [Burkholderia multivorans]PRF30575.1 hypothetical protein C6Q08_20380 [Burkholderia multivorans]PRG29769.1 hypothetical protein C6T62_22925 [Burkholderia multivorans]
MGDRTSAKFSFFLLSLRSPQRNVTLFSHFKYRERAPVVTHGQTAHHGADRRSRRVGADPAASRTGASSSRIDSSDADRQTKPAGAADAPNDSR